MIACELTAQQTAAKFHVHVNTVYRWILMGYIPAVRRGRQWFIDQDVVDSMVNEASHYFYQYPIHMWPWLLYRLRESNATR